MAKVTGSFVKCKHNMSICGVCGATFCLGECKSWTESGEFSYILGNVLSREKNPIPYREITKQGTCKFHG